VRLRDVRPPETPSVAAGVLRQRVLGSEGVYRVLHRSGSTVEAEVIAAPGLEAGARLHLTVAAAAAMGLHTHGAGREQSRVRSAARGARLAARGGRGALGYLSRQVPARVAPTDRAG
jgi:hypothetical protein